IPKNCPPDWEWPARSLVAISKARDVKALLIEISILPIQAPSIRTCATRFPPPSTTAIFIGCVLQAHEITNALTSQATASRHEESDDAEGEEHTNIACVLAWASHPAHRRIDRKST